MKENKLSKNLRVAFEIKAKCDLKSFIETFRRKNIPLYDIKIAKNRISFTSPLSNREKIFAISDNMCYNVIEKGYKGKFALFAKMLDKIVLAAVFVALGIFARVRDNRIGKIVYLGDGAELKKSIELVLNAEKIGVGTKFPDDLNSLSGKIASSGSEFSFVSVKKSGQALVIEAIMSIGKSIPLNEWKTRIVSPCEGIVRRISVYGGTALTAVGSEVKKGDVLIGGFYEKNGEKFETEASGDVEIIVTEEFTQKTDGEGKLYEDRLKAVARERFSDKDLLSIETKLIEPKTYLIILRYVVLAK